MRKIVSVIFVCLIACAVSSQNKISYFGIEGSAYAQWHYDNTDLTDSKTGAGAELTLGYHFQKDRFIFTVGLSAAFASTRLGVQTGDEAMLLPATDSRGVDYRMVVDMKNRVDRSRTMDIRLPLLFGMDINNWYWLAGPVFVANLRGNTLQTAEIRTKGRYDRYYEDLVNLPQHGFHDFEKIESKGSMKFLYDARLAVEGGYTFHFSGSRLGSHASSSNALRVGLFAEFGLNNIRPSSSKALLTGQVLDENGKLTVTMNHAYSSHSTDNNWVRTALVGVRLTYMIRLKIRQGNYCPCHKL